MQLSQVITMVPRTWNVLERGWRLVTENAAQNCDNLVTFDAARASVPVRCGGTRGQLIEFPLGVRFAKSRAR